MGNGNNMADKWQVASLEVEHFRGVIDPVTMGFGPELNVILGNNGAGKTSLCHAIEWVLFGRLPIVTRDDEFRDEDAIANRLAQADSTSRVSLALKHDGQQARITRTRPRGSSSTSGPST